MSTSHGKSGIPPNDSCKSDFSHAHFHGPFYNAESITITNGTPANSAEEIKEPRTSTKARTIKIFSLAIGTIVIVSFATFVLVRFKGDLNQDGLIAVCETVKDIIAFLTLFFKTE